MKKLLFIILISFLAVNSYAQELDNASQQNNESGISAQADKKKVKKPDFNKKKITLDRIEDKKWSLRLGYSYFFPQNKYSSVFTHKLKVGGAYDFNKYLQVAAFVYYSTGSNSHNINGVDTSFTGTMYNLGVVATGLYPFELSTGEISPFASLGGVYTFGNMKSSANGVEQRHDNIQGGGIIAQAGLQYNINILSIRLYGEYLYDFTNVKINHVESLSGASIGVELGVKF